MGNCFITRRGGGGGTAKGAPVIAVVNEAALPASAEEGTIAIISTIAVNDIYVSAATPSPAKTGDVHMIPAASAAFEYRIGNALIPFTTINQFNGSGWVGMTAFMYTDGEWKASRTYLLNGKDQCEGLTGGWEFKPSFSATVEWVSNGIKLTAANNGYQTCQTLTKNNISMTGFSRLCFAGTLDTNLPNQNAYSQKMGLLNVNGAKEEATGLYVTFPASTSVSATGAFEASVDVSSYSGAQYRVGIYCPDIMTITQIWLEE